MPFLIQLSILMTLTPFLLGLAIKNKRRLSKDIKWFLLFLGAAVFGEVIITLLSLYKINNAGAMGIYSVLEFGLIIYILTFWLGQKNIKKIFLLSIPVYWMFYLIVNFSGLESLGSGQINYLTRPIGLMIIFAFSLYTLHHLHFVGHRRLYTDYRFWILSGMIIYSAGGVIVFAFIYVGSRSNGLVFLAYFHAVLNIIHNLFYAIGVFIILRSSRHIGKDTLNLNYSPQS